MDKQSKTSKAKFLHLKRYKKSLVKGCWNESLESSGQHFYKVSCDTDGWHLISPLCHRLLESGVYKCHDTWHKQICECKLKQDAQQNNDTQDF